MSAIKNSGPLLDPGLCRCCRSIKRCRILTKEYDWMGQKEVYSDMIMDCFGILLSHIDENEKDCGVCATCVVRLREASTFRRQVLQCEEMMLESKLWVKEAVDVLDMDKLEDIQKKLDVELKAEPKEDFDEKDSVGGFHEDDAASMSFSPGPIEDIKSPKVEDELSATKPVLTKPTSSDEEDDLPLIREKSKKKAGRKVKGTKKAASSKKKAMGKLKGEKKGRKSGDSPKSCPKPTKKPVEKKDTTERDLDYMSEENLLTIIEYSYACPFKNRRNNYYCYYCKDYYPKPEDLREHTVTHDTKPFQLLMGYKKMPKLDITRIDCKLCPTKIDDLTTFKNHIDQVHNKKVYFEAPDKMLLFRLTWNNLVCVMCSDVFEDFNGLNTHMVGHFSNFTCDVCGMCFLEKPRLDAHLKRHKDDEKHTCEVCGKVFKSNHYKEMHVDIVHKKKAIIRCPLCDECFMSYALKNKHLQDSHGQKRVYPCNLCDKVYNRQKTLTEHQRRNHQKVLKHQCEYCEQRFYLPSRLREHMATHTGERNFRCEHCDKSYPRLKSLQYHIRTHTNDRRYRCHICGQAFIQNASLKSHIKTHHPECELEGCYY